MTGDLTERVRRCVDAQREDAIALLSELISVNSVNPTFPGVARDSVIGGETRCNEILAERYQRSGVEVHWVATDDERRNLVAVRKGSGGGPGLMLNGHVDTVPPVEPGNWTHGDPWKPAVRDDYLYGLGATDMKAGIVAMTLVANTLGSLGINLRGDLQFHSVVGEETWEHELGTTACVEAGFAAEGAVVMEATSAYRPMSLTTISSALWNLSVHVEGKSTHAGNRYYALRPGGAGDAIGVNALEKGVKVVQMLQELETEWGMTRNHPAFPPGFFTLMPGVFYSDAGYPVPFYFPDKATISYDVWHNPDQSAEEVSQEIEAFVAAGCQLDTWMRDHPPRFEWISHYPPFSTDWNAPLVQSMAGAHADVSGRPVTEPTPSEPAHFGAVCDASWLQLKGISSVVFGPGDGRLAHCLDERVEIGQILEAAATVTLGAINYLGIAD